MVEGDKMFLQPNASPTGRQSKLDTWDKWVSAFYTFMAIYIVKFPRRLFAWRLCNSRGHTLKTPGSDLTRKRVRGGQTHFGVRPTRNPGQTDPESESERHFGLRFR